MNLLNKLLLLSFATLSLSAQTTMCFKQNHKSFSTISDTKLDGGLCNSEKTYNDMLKDGWESSDIKIDGNNYIYIFKKQTNTSSVNIADIEATILKRLEIRKVEAAKAAKVEKRLNMSVSGKKMYIQKCKSCHGDKGELKANNTSRVISNLNLADFKLSIRDYKIGEYDRGRAFLMKPYALLMDSNDIKNVFVYLQSLKTQEEKVDNKKEASK